MEQLTTVPRAGRTSVPAPAAPPRQRTLRVAGAPGEPGLVGYLYILPVLAFFVLFVLVPMAQTGWISLFHWDGISVGTWAGLENYADILSSTRLRNAFLHSVVLILFYAVLPVLLGLFLTVLLSRARVRGMTFFRTVLFLPQVAPALVMAVVWQWIYAPDGPLNELLRAVGAGAVARPWLGDFTWALPSLGMVGTWAGFGLCLVLFLTGVQNIDRDLYDAAKVDGAGAVREFFAVTLPALRPQIAVALTLTSVGALRTFDLVYLMTSGGPGTSTSVPAWELYQRAFLTGQVGSAAAIGVVLTVIVFAVSFGVVRVAEGRRT